MNGAEPIYDFAFRGFLAEEALDKAGRQHPNLVGAPDEEYAKRLGINLFDEQLVASARQMAVVYMAVTAFENSVRKFISAVLLDKVGAAWWDSAVSGNIKKK